MKRKRIVNMVTAIICLLPLIAGAFGFGNAAQAAEEKVNVTLHKKKMDQFPTHDVENTGEEMDEFNQYEGLPGITFEAWDITADFYEKLNGIVGQNASDAEYATAVKGLMKSFKLEEAAKAQSKGSDITNEAGIVTFSGLDKRTAEGIYKVYLFEEKAADGVEGSSFPLILILPVVKDDVENTDIHLYPKNKVKGDIGKELVDETGTPLTGENRYDFEVGQKIYYHASFTIPNQIGEILNQDGAEQTRYSQLQFKDAVTKEGVKFEGIDRISIGDTATNIKDTFLSHGAVEYTNTVPNYTGLAGFDIQMNLNKAKSSENAEDFQKSKTTAEYLKDFGGKTLHIYYAVSFTDETPVDVDINNKFSVEMTHDGDQKDSENHTPTSPITTGGKKFMKHEAGKENQALDGAKFVVIKKENEKFYYYTNAGDQVEWVEVKADEDYAGATHFVSKNGGHLQVSGLAFGTYYLREIEAPNGFQLLTEDKEFEVSKGSFDETEQLKIANVSKGGFLPSTGGKGIIAFLIVGLALMLGAFIKYRRLQQTTV